MILKFFFELFLSKKRTYSFGHQDLIIINNLTKINRNNLITLRSNVITMLQVI